MYGIVSIAPSVKLPNLMLHPIHFGQPSFLKYILSFFLCEHRESRVLITAHSVCYPWIVYSHFEQKLSLPFMWLIGDIYVLPVFSRVRKLNFWMQEIALPVQKVTKCNQLSVTSRGLSGLRISCATMKGNLLYNTVTNQAQSSAFFLGAPVMGSDPAGNSAQNVSQPNWILIVSSDSCTSVLQSYSILHCPRK